MDPPIQLVDMVQLGWVWIWTLLRGKKVGSVKSAPPPLVAVQSCCQCQVEHLQAVQPTPVACIIKAITNVNYHASIVHLVVYI